MLTPSITEAPARRVVAEVVDRYEVPENVVKAVAHVRRVGIVDMYDRETVMLLAANLGHGEAMEWLVENRHLYFEALRRAD